MNSKLIYGTKIKQAYHLLIPIDVSLAMITKRMKRMTKKMNITSHTAKSPCKANIKQYVSNDSDKESCQKT